MYTATFYCSRFGVSFDPIHINTENLSVAKNIASRHATQKLHMIPADTKNAWITHDNINHHRYFTAVPESGFKVNIKKQGEPNAKQENMEKSTHISI